MTCLYLLIDIAGEHVAIPANEVESVVEIEALTPVPGAAPHILGLSALRSRVLTVIDCRISLGIDPAEQERREAIVVNIAGHPYALLTDRVDDVIEGDGAVQPVKTILAPGWMAAARGSVEIQGSVYLLLDPRALVEGPAREAA